MTIHMVTTRRKCQLEHRLEMHTHASVICLSNILPIGTAGFSAFFVESVVYASTPVVVSLRLSFFELATCSGLFTGGARAKFEDKWYYREQTREQCSVTDPVKRCLLDSRFLVSVGMSTLSSSLSLLLVSSSWAWSLLAAAAAAVIGSGLDSGHILVKGTSVVINLCWDSFKAFGLSFGCLLKQRCKKSFASANTFHATHKMHPYVWSHERQKWGET